jgi:hypothetical protein
MVRFIILLAISAGLFVAGLGASWFMMKKETGHADPGAATTAADPVTEKFPADPHAPPPGDAAKGEHLPISVRADGKSSAEEIFRQGSTFRTQYEAIQRREESLRQEKIRLKLVMEDVKSERRELDALRAEAEDAIVAAEKLLAKIEADKASIQDQKQATEKEIETIKKSQIELDASETTNLKKISDILQSTPPETAAATLKQLANDGKMAMVVKLLGTMEESKTAKIMSSIEDPAIVAQLMDAYRNLKLPAPAPKRK